MLPRLEARESITAAMRVAFGSGCLKEEDSRSTMGDWLDAANDGRAPRRVAAPRPTDEQLRKMGVLVQRALAGVEGVIHG